MSYRDRLQSRIDRTGSRLCVGLDPRPGRIEGEVGSYLRRVVRDVEPVVAAFKPNLAYFEAMGVEGYRLLDGLLGDLPRDVPVILDGKRCDIPETQRHYARAYFERWDVDAVTLCPYMGYDSLEPFLQASDRGVYLLGVTSNPGARDLQLADDARLFRRVLSMVRDREHPATSGLVMGLTHLTDELLGALRGVPLLVPGLGPQGGQLERLVGAESRAPLLVNSSRSVLYGQADESDPDAWRDRAENYRDRINDALGE